MQAHRRRWSGVEMLSMSFFDGMFEYHQDDGSIAYIPFRFSCQILTSGALTAFLRKYLSLL